MGTWHTAMTGWHTSSYTHYEENACVEVGSGLGQVGVRDSKQGVLADQARPVLVFTVSAFTGFLDHLKTGVTGPR